MFMNCINSINDFNKLIVIICIDISGVIVIDRGISSQVVVQVHLHLYSLTGWTAIKSSSPNDSPSASVSVLGQCLQHNTYEVVISNKIDDNKRIDENRNVFMIDEW
jgi:hypothetical protein